MSKSRNRKSSSSSKPRSNSNRRYNAELTRYPSIDGPNGVGAEAIGQPCIAFKKYDGSNLQFSWNQSDGWYRYGTRRRTVRPDNPLFGNAIELFQNKYATGIIEAVRRYKEYRNTKSLTAFCEFYGEKTFSGLHVDEDPKEIKLFDIMLDDSNLVLPADFKHHFGHLDIAEIVFEGELTKTFITQVRAGEVVAGEGVVAKGVKTTARRKGKSERTAWMVKIKTQDWLDELARRAGASPDKFDTELQDNQRQQNLA